MVREVESRARAEEVALALARNIVQTRFEDLPPEAVRATKEHFLHTLGIILGGSNQPGCDLIVRQAVELGGDQSTILAWGLRASAPFAAMANASMGHALDFDNNDDRIAYKTSVCAIPAAVAMGEALGGRPGKEVLTAACLGVDLGIRMGLAINPKPAHPTAPMLGPFCAAAAAAKLLGLDEEGVVNALGLAFCSATPNAGTSTASPSLTKRLGPGLAAAAGVNAARLAQKGFPAARNILSGPRGLYCLFFGEEGDMEALTAELGRVFEIVNVGPKPYPSCRYTHASVDAALALVHSYDLQPDQVAEVTVRLSPRDFHGVGGGDPEAPLAKRRRPEGVVDAQFSVPYTVATAIVKRKLFIEDFSPEALQDPAVLAMAQRVTPVPVPELEQRDIDVKPAIVEIRTRDGRLLIKRVDFPRGNPLNPVPLAEMEEKFRACARHAVNPLPERQVEEASAAINALEELPDIRALTRLLVP